MDKTYKYDGEGQFQLRLYKSKITHEVLIRIEEATNTYLNILVHHIEYKIKLLLLVSEN